MPRVRTSNSQKFPEGWEIIEGTLEDINARMKEAEREPHEGKRKCESLWPIFGLNRERSRYIYEQYYKEKTISRELYDFCLREGYADAGLIAKWKKPGYEKLCCLGCIQTSGQNFGTTCICRVPKKSLDPESRSGVECVQCGCHGCASGD